MRVLILTFFLFITVSGFTQEYGIEVIPFHNANASPTVAGLSIFNDDLLIPAIYPGGVSTLIKYNTLVDNDIEYIDIDRFDFSIEPFAMLDNQLYLFAKDRLLDNDLRIKEFDQELNEVNTYTYTNNWDYSFPCGMITISDNLYIASFFESDSETNNQRLTNIKKLSASGSIVWEVDYGYDNTRNYIYKMIPSTDDEILVSTEIHNSGVYHYVHKISKATGEILWTYIDPEEVDLLQGRNKLTQLHDGNIVLRSTQDRNFDTGYGSTGWWPVPPKLSWITSEGEFIRDTLLQSDFDNSLYLYDITTGLGDYFFGYGRWKHPVTGEIYAWIFKMSNEGEMIWDKQFRHEDYPEYSHSTRGILEMENGDIYVLASARIPTDYAKILLMKINEHGCFGDESCDDAQIYSSTYDIDISDAISILPNPARHTLEINSPCSGKLALFDMNGRKLAQHDAVGDQTQIDISRLPTGVISYRLVCDDGVAVGTFVRM